MQESSDEGLETDFSWSRSRSRGDLFSVSCFLNWSRDQTFIDIFIT